ncbi:TetR/AcrR family transcriptional regulator [Lentzea sp. NBRC 105346]|uniref:TetR/AcrR family transcriptional regulator n=1 Tax=Lentzea sp. NBRC 105346 TaxID=3032205 RepID=UPI0033266759
MDGRLERGEQTRRLIVRRAAEIASAEGLETLSIGRLAADLGLSKSGVFALFGSKEDLQLATVRAARESVVSEVVRPALAAENPLWAVIELWLSYSERRVFPGGCFFSSVRPEFDSRPGRVRDEIASLGREWEGLFERLARDAGLPDPAQLAFEIVAILDAANANSMLYDDASAYDKARVALRARIAMPTGTEINVATPNDTSIASSGSSTT